MWDIPSSTILAIMPECLPIDAPKALQKEALYELENVKVSFYIWFYDLCFIFYHFLEA